MYTPQIWSDHDPTYPVSAARMQHLEAGVQSATTNLINAQDYGAVGDNSHDDTSAIINALADLPPVAGGIGGGAVILPPTPTNIYKASGTITLGPGQGLISHGMQGPQLQGTVAGTFIDGPGASYGRLENLVVVNKSSNINARALSLSAGTSNFSARRVYFSAAAAAGEIVRLDFSHLTTFMDCKMGGSLATACEVCLRQVNGSNETRLIASSFTDAGAGAALFGGLGAFVAGCQFESFGSVGALGAGLCFSGLYGAAIMGNYFEDTPGYGIVGFASVDTSSAIIIGGNAMQSNRGSAGGFINIDNCRNSTVLPNFIEPGGVAPNAVGVSNLGSLAHTNTVYPQYKTSGTGLEVNGGIIERAGPGSPEGVVTANIGSRYWRTDGGATTTLYVKTSGTGNTGWTAK